jgi:hypothetical protein
VGAEKIALRSGATIVGSFESIRIMAEYGVPAEQLMPVVILEHHDDWLPAMSAAVDTALIRAAIGETCPTAEPAEMDYCAGFEVFG